MSDSISITDALAQFAAGSQLEAPSIDDDGDDAEEIGGGRRADETDEAEDADESRRGRRARRGGGGRDRLRAAFARGRRSGPAVLVDFSQGARRAQAAQAAEVAEEDQDVPQAREQAPADRRALGGEFRQARQEFNATVQPAGAGGAARPQGGAAAVPVGLDGVAGQETGIQPRGGQGGAVQAQGFQVVTPTISAADPPPELEGIRLATSFEQTALGFALTQGNSPAERAAALGNRGTLAQALGQQRGLGVATPIDGNNTPVAGVAQTNGGAEDTPGPLGTTRERLDNPGGAADLETATPRITDRRPELTRGAIGQGQLTREPLTGQGQPSPTGGNAAGEAPAAADPALAGAGGAGNLAVGGAPNPIEAGDEPLDAIEAARPNRNVLAPQGQPVGTQGGALGGQGAGGPASNAGGGLPTAGVGTPVTVNIPNQDVGPELPQLPAEANVLEVPDQLTPEAVATNRVDTPAAGNIPVGTAGTATVDPAPDANPDANPAAGVPPPEPDEDAENDRTPPGVVADDEARAGAGEPAAIQAAGGAEGIPAAAGGITANPREPTGGGFAPIAEANPGAEAVAAPVAELTAAERLIRTEEDEEANAPPTITGDVAAAAGVPGAAAQAVPVGEPANEPGAPAAPDDRVARPIAPPPTLAEQQELAAQATVAFEIQQLEDRTNRPRETPEVAELFIR